MPNESWMQHALQTSEAVLLPALERRTTPTSRFGNRYLVPDASTDVFQPVSHSWEQPSPAPAAQSARQGSMAGRSVLRAAGVRCTPTTRRPWRRHP